MRGAVVGERGEGEVGCYCGGDGEWACVVEEGYREVSACACQSVGEVARWVRHFGWSI